MNLYQNKKNNMSSLNIKKWKLNKNIKFLFKIFKKNNEETRFIGGCVRDLIIKISMGTWIEATYFSALL